MMIIFISYLFLYQNNFFSCVDQVQICQFQIDLVLETVIKN